MSKYLIENLFGIEGWNISWYGVIIACGMLLGLALAVYRAKKENIHSDVLYDFLLIAAPVAILCARAYYGNPMPMILSKYSRYGRVVLPSTEV